MGSHLPLNLTPDCYKCRRHHTCCYLSRFDSVQWPVWRWRWFCVSRFGERTRWVSLRCWLRPSCHYQWWDQLFHLAYFALQKTPECRRVLYSMQLCCAYADSHGDIRPWTRPDQNPVHDIILAFACDRIQISHQCLDPESCKNKPGPFSGQTLYKAIVLGVNFLLFLCYRLISFRFCFLVLDLISSMLVYQFLQYYCGWLEWKNVSSITYICIKWVSRLWCNQSVNEQWL